MVPNNLKKISDRLYEEPSSSGRSLKWLKLYEPLTVELTDVQASESVQLDVKGVGLGDENRIRNIKGIYAHGTLEPRRNIGLLDPNEKDLKLYEHVEVSIHAAGWKADAPGTYEFHERKPPALSDPPAWSDVSAVLDEMGQEKSPWNYAIHPGSLAYVADDLLNWGDRDEPYISLELLVPEEALLTIWNRLANGEQFSKVRLGVYVEVFQSEMERSLSEPYHFQVYYIERGFHFNAAFLSHLTVITEPTAKRSAVPLDETSNDVEDHGGASRASGERVSARPLTTDLRGIRRAIYVLTAAIVIGVIARIF